MSEKKNSGSELFENIEPLSMLTDILRSLWAIVLGSLAVAMITMMVFTSRATTTYTSNVTLAVMSKRLSNGGTSVATLSSTRSVATSFTNILNSEIMKKMVCDDVGLETFDATASAKSIGDTNLITLTVTSNSPEKTFRIIRSIMKQYPNLIQYFNTSMVMEVLAQPQVPTRTVSGRSAISMAKRAFVMAFAVLTLAFAYLSYRHDTIKSEKDLREKLDANSLGSIDYEHLRKTRRDLKKKNILLSDVTTSFSFVEQYKKIAAAVLQSAERHKAKVLMISSVAEHEGKSTVAANLALAIKGQGKDVLLIDCDLRRPSQAKIFGIDVKEGTSLTDLLDGKARSGKDIIYFDSRSGLLMILTNQGSHESTEYLKDGNFARLISNLRNSVDIIILDTPPMSLMADAETVANISDLSILVVQYNRTLAEDINDAIDELKKYRCHMSGCILNGVRTLPGFGRKIIGNYYGNYGRYGKYGKYGKYGHYGAYGNYGAYGHYAERQDPTASAKKTDSVKETLKNTETEK